MKKRKRFIAAVACILLLGVVILFRHSPAPEPGEEIAEQFRNAEQALQVLDEEWTCKGGSKVTPFSYVDAEGNRVIYYCCQTRYAEGYTPDTEGLDLSVLELVVDFSATENQRACQVSGRDAILCELDGRTYLCWTLSPELSCVIEYSPDVVAEGDIFQMAESIQLPSDTE